MMKAASIPLVKQVRLLQKPALVKLPLPPASKPKTLVLDLDETLVNSRFTGNDTVDVYLRPHVIEFLTDVRQWFDVVVWSAGVAHYVQAVVAMLESHCPPSSPMQVLDRSHCLEEWAYMKYLPLLGRDMAHTVMIDDLQRSYPLTPRNGIRITSFRAGGSKDEGLKNLMPLMRALHDAPNVIDELNHWRCDDYTLCDEFLCATEGKHFRPDVWEMLGAVAAKRRTSGPIPQLVNFPTNARLCEKAVKTWSSSQSVSKL